MAARGQHRLLAAGARAPEFRLPLLSGGEMSLAEILAGGPVLLAFFKISCPVCQMTFPFLERIHAAGAVRIFAVSQNDARDTDDFNREFGVTFPTLLDSETDNFPASNDYGISSVPTLFQVEPDGRISNVIEGWRKVEMGRFGESMTGGVFRAGDNVPEWKAG